MKAIDPTLKSMIFTYTDTDSLHILGKDAQKLEELGYIKSKNESKLGYLCADINDEGIITKEINLAPKTYIYEYIDKNNYLNGDTPKKRKKENDKIQKIREKSENIIEPDDNDDIKVEKQNRIEKEIKDLFVGTMKSKGIPKKCLKFDMYENYENEKQICKFSGLKRIHKRITSKQREIGIHHFSIINNTQTRTFMAKNWDGFDFKDNQFYPKGYKK